MIGGRGGKIQNVCDTPKLAKRDRPSYKGTLITPSLLGYREGCYFDDITPVADLDEFDTDHLARHYERFWLEAYSKEHDVLFGFLSHG
jgi:hypothetical protein